MYTKQDIIGVERAMVVMRKPTYCIGFVSFVLTLANYNSYNAHNGI